MPTYTPKLNIPKPVGTDGMNRLAQEALVNAIENIANIVQMKKLTADTGFLKLPPSTDINTCFETGLYYVGSTSVGNAPVAQVGTMEVYQFNANTSLQRYTLMSSATPVTYVRYAASGVWGPWHKNDFVDSGYITPTLLNGVQHWSGSSQFQVRKIGNIIYLQGAVKNVVAFPTTVCTLPSGMRPNKAQALSVVGSLDSGLATFVRVVVLTTGDVVIEGRSNGTTFSGAWYPIQGTFPVD